MPELAEVEFYRKQWSRGIGHKITRFTAHTKTRLFRGCDLSALGAALPGAVLAGSEAHGKQLMFFLRSSGGQRAWLGLHMGMTGKLGTAPADYHPDRHDHLVLFQNEQALVFADFRQFGRVRFGVGEESPEWWRELPPPVLSPRFTAKRLEAFLERKRRAPIKSLLLMQEAFPGIGNWMADEILWRAEIRPDRLAGDLAGEERRRVWREARAVARGALKTVGVDFRDPPKDWLFHARWKKGGTCPRTGQPLDRTTVGGRTTCWSPALQK